jgi:hypothetical protein
VATATATLGVAGGTVEVDTGESVTFPPGSVGADTTVTLSVFAPEALPTPPAGRKTASHGIDLQPSGVTFDPPARITIPYDPAALGGEDPATLGVWVYQGGAWQLLGGVVDPVAHTVTISVSHFTLYAVMVRGEGLPPQSTMEPAAPPTPTPGGSQPVTGVTSVPSAGAGSVNGDPLRALLSIAAMAAAVAGGLSLAAGMGRRSR